MSYQRSLSAGNSAATSFLNFLKEKNNGQIPGWKNLTSNIELDLWISEFRSQDEQTKGQLTELLKNIQYPEAFLKLEKALAHLMAGIAIRYNARLAHLIQSAQQDNKSGLTLEEKTNYFKGTTDLVFRGKPAMVINIGDDFTLSKQETAGARKNYLSWFDDLKK